MAEEPGVAQRSTVRSVDSLMLAAPPTPEPLARPYRLLAALTAVAAVFFVLYGNDHGLWLDEAFSVELAGEDMGEIVAGLRADVHPPLYFLLLARWIDLWGDSEAAVRSLSGIFYLATAAAIFALAITVFRDSTTAFFATFFFVISKTAVAHAQNARMYALLALLVTLSTLFFWRAFIRGNPRSSDAFFYVTFTALGPLTHFWFCFTMAAQGITGLVLGAPERRGRFLLCLALASTPFAVLWAPILLRDQIHNGAVDWMAEVANHPLALLRTFTDYYGEGLPAVAMWVGFFAVLFGRVEGGRPRLVRGRLAQLAASLRQRKNAVFGLLLATSLLLPFLVSQVKPIYRTGSYTIIGLVPLVLLLGSLLSRFGQRSLVVLFLSGLLVGTSAAYGWIRSRPEACSDRAAAAWLLENARDGDTVVFTSLSRLAVEHYLDRLTPPRRLDRRDFPRSQAAHPGWRSLPDLLERRGELAVEASQLAAELRRQAAAGADVWLLYGVDRQVGGLLKKRLDAELSAVETWECRTEFFSSIVHYRLPPGGAPPRLPPP